MVTYENKYFKIMEDKNYGNEEEIFRFSYGSNGSFTSSSICRYFRWNEGQPQNVDVTVNGSVNSNTGIAPQGKLEVELPVSMDFSVDKWYINGTSYNVTNKVNLR